MVKAGQVVAVMDTRDLQAELKQYQQIVLQDQRTLDQVTANYASEQAVVKFDQQEVARSIVSVPKGFCHTGNAGPADAKPEQAQSAL